MIDGPWHGHHLNYCSCGICSEKEQAEAELNLVKNVDIVLGIMQHVFIMFLSVCTHR